MLIAVTYLSGENDMVKNYFLDDLIAQQQILRFKRRDGWVNASGPHLRQKDKEKILYSGEERRNLNVR